MGRGPPRAQRRGRMDSVPLPRPWGRGRIGGLGRASPPRAPAVGEGPAGAAEAAPLAVLPARVGALAAFLPQTPPSATGGGHCPCRSLPPSRPLSPPPPLPPQPPPLRSRERGAASAPAPPPPPPQRPRPPFGTRNFPAPAPLGDSRRRGGGGPGAARGCSGAPGPPRPRHGPGSATAGDREARSAAAPPQVALLAAR